MGHMNLDCGYLFHCPVLSGMNSSDLLPTPLIGALVMVPSSLNVDELTCLIYRPPEHRVTKLSPWDEILV